jgi:hypothetical protein
MMDEKRWRKSSHSQATNSCIEVSDTLDELRDSKDPSGPTLRVNVAALLRAVKAGRFDR